MTLECLYLKQLVILVLAKYNLALLRSQGQQRYVLLTVDANEAMRVLHCFDFIHLP